MENTLKLVELIKAEKAIDNEVIDMTTDLDALSERARAAYSAVWEEKNAARKLEQQFYTEFNDAEQDSGLCNARDTASEYGLYQHGELVEQSTEFWQCAIGSAQFMRDCA